MDEPEGYCAKCDKLAGQRRTNTEWYHVFVEYMIPKSSGSLEEK